jgi:ferritin-like metal-binding protein YciE
MSSATETLIDHLREAQASEQASLSLLEGHLRGAPPGPYRTAVRRHLDETRRHAQQVGERLTDLGAGTSPVGAAITLGEAVVGRFVGLALAPLHVLSGRTKPDELLRDAEDEIAAEAREVATYTALERIADHAGDSATASLARTIRADEERHLDELRRMLPGMADRVARERMGAAPLREERTPTERRPPPAPATSAPTNGGPVHTERETPYAERAERRRAARREAPKVADGPSTAEAARARARETDEVVETEGAAAPGAQIRVDAPWDGYDRMKAGDIVARLRSADEATRAMVRLYEQATKGRKSVLEATGQQAQP